MATTLLGLANDYEDADDLPADDVTDLANAAELLAAVFAEVLGVSGVRLTTDWNGAIVAGALSIDLSAGYGIVGDAGSRKPMRTTATIRVTGLTPSTTNYLYKTQTADATASEFSATTSATPAANTVQVCSAVTNGTEVTSVSQVPASRVNLGAALWARAVQTLYAALTLDEGVNLILGTVTGTKIGTSATQKLGFFNVTPVVRPSALTQTYATADRTHAALTSADLTGISSSTTGSALAEPSAAYTQAEMQQNFRRIQDQYNALKADLTDLKQFVNSLTDDLQSLGLLQ